MTAEGFFLLYKNLLSKDAQFHWDDIVLEQIRAAPWINLRGKKHKRAHEKMQESFQGCITFHLQTMFPSDATEQQHFDISNIMKKAQ